MKHAKLAQNWQRKLFAIKKTICFTRHSSAITEARATPDVQIAYLVNFLIFLHEGRKTARTTNRKSITNAN